MAVLTFTGIAAGDADASASSVSHGTSLLSASTDVDGVLASVGVFLPKPVAVSPGSGAVRAVFVRVKSSAVFTRA
jgi:hypothetical protein